MIIFYLWAMLITGLTKLLRKFLSTLTLQFHQANMPTYSKADNNESGRWNQQILVFYLWFLILKRFLRFFSHISILFTSCYYMKSSSSILQVPSTCYFYLCCLDIAQACLFLLNFTSITWYSGRFSLEPHVSEIVNQSSFDSLYPNTISIRFLITYSLWSIFYVYRQDFYPFISLYPDLVLHNLHFVEKLDTFISKCFCF